VSNIEQTAHPSRVFTAQTHFMSLPGYLRYVTHQQGDQWLTYAEAARIVQQQ